MGWSLSPFLAARLELGDAWDASQVALVFQKTPHHMLSGAGVPGAAALPSDPSSEWASLFLPVCVYGGGAGTLRREQESICSSSLCKVQRFPLVSLTLGLSSDLPGDSVFSCSWQGQPASLPRLCCHALHPARSGPLPSSRTVLTGLRRCHLSFGHSVS